MISQRLGDVNVDIALLEFRIKFFYSQAPVNAVAELTVGALLALARNLSMRIVNCIKVNGTRRSVLSLQARRWRLSVLAASAAAWPSC